VRAAALRAIGKLCGDRDLETLVQALDDKKQRPRVQALAALLRDAGIEGSIAGGARLAELLAAPERKRRIEATRVLSELGHGAYRPIRRLLEDDDAKVRRAALKAAEHAPDARLVPLLLAALHEPRTSARAGRAIAALGLAAVEPLLELLGDRSASRHVRLEIPRILRRIEPAPEIFEALLSHAAIDEPQIRLRVLGTLARVRDELSLPPLSLAEVLGRIETELSEAYALLAGWSRAKGEYGTPLMEQSMLLLEQRAGERILRILELRYSRAPLHLVRRALNRPSRRANAMELLDGMMEPALRVLVLPFFDDRSLEELIESAQVDVAPAPEPLDFMLAQCRHPKPFLVASALDALAGGPKPKVFAAAFARWDHPSRLVRETALVGDDKVYPVRPGDRLADRARVAD
jgi:HEAT repeat protein